MGKDYYQILQLTRSAKDSDIKAAYVTQIILSIKLIFCFVYWLHRYRRLALKFHPVKNTNDHNALTKFHDLAEAYDVLSDRTYLIFVSIFFAFSLISIKIRQELFMINMVTKV